MPTISILVWLLANGSIPIASCSHASIEDMRLAPASSYSVRDAISLLQLLVSEGEL